MPDYHIDDDLNKAWSINNDFDRLIINYFYKLIDNDED